MTDLNGTIITGLGTIKGTDYRDYITTDDYEGQKARNDVIKAGKGNDIINAGKGKNSIYFYSGDGNDTIINGGGEDTLVFEKGTELTFTQEDGSKDLVIKYGNGSVTLKDYDSAEGTSIRYIKVGNTKKTLEKYMGTEIEIPKGSKVYKITPSKFHFGEYTYEDIVFTKTTSYDALKFEPSEDISFRRYYNEGTENNLCIDAYYEKYDYFGTIILQDYFSNENFPIQFIQNYGKITKLEDDINKYGVYSIINKENSIAKGTDGNDSFYCNAENYVIDAGKGDDYIPLNSNSKCIFHSGDGNDIVNIPANAEYLGTLVFEDEENIINNLKTSYIKDYQVGYGKMGYNSDVIQIKYNNEKDSVTIPIDSYRAQFATYTIQTENETFLVHSRGIMYNDTNKIIYGTSNDDDFQVSSNSEKIMVKYGENEYYQNIEGKICTINGGQGNDSINFSEDSSFINVYANIKSDGTFDDNLYLTDYNGTVIIKNYFNENCETELITANNKTKQLESFAVTDSIKNSVVNWLEENNCADVYAAITDSSINSTEKEVLKTVLAQATTWE